MVAKCKFNHCMVAKCKSDQMVLCKMQKSAMRIRPSPVRTVFPHQILKCPPPPCIYPSNPTLQTLISCTYLMAKIYTHPGILANENCKNLQCGYDPSPLSAPILSPSPSCIYLQNEHNFAKIEPSPICPCLFRCQIMKSQLVSPSPSCIYQSNPTLEEKN
jgi:hypothetical protein